MPRMEGREKPLRDIENLLIDYWLIHTGSWLVFKCDCCDRTFGGEGWLLEPESDKQVPVTDAWNRDDVKSYYGAKVSDAVRVHGDEDWEYKPGEWSGFACPACTRKIEASWIVMPGDPPADGEKGEVRDA